MPAKKQTQPRNKSPAGKIAHKRSTRKTADAAEDESDTRLKTPDFRVVGIGASAGGLEAMTRLLQNLPKDSSMAYVLIQHLAPRHESMMAELLDRVTSLDVSEATEGLRLAPDNVYIIPPNTTLGILNGVLHLLPRDENTHQMPIDYFFQSLALDQGRNAIGVILSGSASDGTLGCRAIKAEGGITIAQEPETASYDSMPSSAIASGCIDFVLSPEMIAEEIVRIALYPERSRARLASDSNDPVRVKSELSKIFMLLRNRTGNDFSNYKHATIRRRISRRMLVNRIERLQDYVRFLNSQPAEVDALFHDILINVTRFFRDPEAFDELKKSVFPAIMKNRDPDQPLRIWIVGCSSGEEAYSTIICLLELLDDRLAGTTIQLFASDIDQQAIDKARIGIYPEGIHADVSRERLQRFFSRVPQGYQINKRLRELCVFATQNVIKDPPFSHMDFISCRNMLIYMGPLLQRRVLQTLNYALDPGGYLLLGSSESIGGSADLFDKEGKRNSLYNKKETSGRGYIPPRAVENASIKPTYPAGKNMVTPQETLDTQKLAEAVILNYYSPPGVIVNEQLDVLHFIGQTGPYLSPTPGAASLKLTKLAHPDLSLELRIAVHDAVREQKTVQKTGACLNHNNRTEVIDIDVVPLPNQGGTYASYLVLFRKISEHETTTSASRPRAKTKADARDTRIEALERELDTTRQNMQSMIAEHDATNEELQSANEEIQSTNEELQSINEELETAKEELQSTNEELITVNEELENRNTELTSINDDMNNIIASSDLAIVMLNGSYCVRFFSPRANRLLNLIESDIGRPIRDIRPNVDIGDIEKHVHHVIDSLKPVYREIQDDKGDWYNMHIRPYRTEDNRINGAIIVFIDITDSKKLQQSSRLATVVAQSNDAIIMHDFKGRILAWNPKASEIYGYTEAEALDSNIDIIVPSDCIQDMKTRIKTCRSGNTVKPFEFERLSKSGERVRMLITMSVLSDQHGTPIAIATTEHPLGED